MKTKKVIIGFGLILSVIAILSYLILFIEITLYDLRPWPSELQWERFVLYESLLWTQYFMHCEFFEPTLLGFVVWKYWGSLLGVGLGLVFKFSTESDLLNKIATRYKFDIVVYSGSGVVFITNCALYFVYATKFQVSYSSYYRLLNPAIMLLLIPGLIVLPVLLFYIYYKGISLNKFKYLLGSFIILILDVILTFLGLAFALWGCA